MIQIKENTKRTLRIIGLYLLGFLLLLIFFLIDNSERMNEFLMKVDRVRTDWSFGFHALVGLLQLILLVSGIALPVLLTAVLLFQRFKK